MKSNSYRVILVSLLMIFSSLAGCLEGDDDTTENLGSLGTVMVSTYHVGELVKAVGGDRVTVDYMSQDNIPVHDYEPSAADLIRLQGADVFFYHGLGLEPWVDSTLESMGGDAPTSIGAHAMPGDEGTLDYEGMLVTELCELLTVGPYESTTLAMDEDNASEIHAEYVAHTLSFPEMDDDHDDHGDDDHDDHDDHEDDDHDDHGDDDHGDDEHDEHDHSDHGHATPEETIENPTDCPADSVISIFHLEEGEYVLEFEEEDFHDFNMAVLKMGGGHAHHDHHGHGDDDHDEHGDDDHDEHGDDDHDEHGEDDHDEHGDDDHADHHAGYVAIHIEVGGEYGFALPHDVEFYVMMGEGHDDHDDHADDEDGHDDQDDDEDGHDDHDDDEDGHDDHDDHEGEETLNYDPHSWLAPLAYKAQLEIVMDGLIAAFPSGEDDFRANAEDFSSQLTAMDDAYEAAFGENGTCAAGGHEKTVVANHNAYSYIAVRYDIQFVTVHGLDPEGEPSPEDIAEVVEHINEEGVTVLFIEEFTDPSAVGSIVQETGVTVEYLYTMEMAPIDSSDDYMSLMNKNLDSLVAGIGC